MNQRAKFNNVKHLIYFVILCLKLCQSFVKIDLMYIHRCDCDCWWSRAAAKAARDIETTYYSYARLFYSNFQGCCIDINKYHWRRIRNESSVDYFRRERINKLPEIQSEFDRSLYEVNGNVFFMDNLWKHNGLTNVKNHRQVHKTPTLSPPNIQWLNFLV